MAALTLSSRTKPRAPDLELLVKGARCANCVAKIERGMKALDGVSDARLNLTTGKLTIHAGNQLDLQSAIRRVQDLGYEAWPFDAERAVSAREQEGRGLVTYLAISGFGVVFVMGLTDTLWYGATDMGAGTRGLISWLAALVASPTALVGGVPFFRSALAGLKAGRANMDVPISLAILFSLALSFYETFAGGGRTYFDAAVMLTFLLLIGRYLDFIVRGRASTAAASLVAMQAVQAARVRHDGTVEHVPARNIDCGDRILLNVGDRAPVDGVVLDHAIVADLSLLTGETAPAIVRPGEALQAGAIVLDQSVVIRAERVLEDSLVARIGRLIEAGQQTRNRYVRLADRAARLYVPVVHGLALAVFIGWLFVPHAGFAAALRNGISLLIITCPCALGLAVPAVQVVATGLLFRRGMLVKSGDALERLAEIDVAVFDKTGTLTEGRPVLEQGGASDAVLSRVARLARASNHPLAKALATAAGSGIVLGGVHEVAGQGVEVADDGVRLRLGRAAFVGAETGPGEATELWYREGEGTAVRFAFSDRLRADTETTLGALRSRHVAVEILSGDRAGPVADAARAGGVTQWAAGLDPIAKTERLKLLRSTGHKVLMVGDGLNDAAALALGHASISPGTAIDATQANADMVFQGTSLWPVVQAVAVSRTARRRMLENFAFAAAYNAIAVPLAALGMVTPLIAAIAMASSSLVVTLNALRQSLPEKG
jgi:Cu2+-exporting ATPase